MSGSRTYAELVRTNARELLRDGKTAFFVLAFPLLFMGMFVGIGLLTAGGTYRVGVAAGPDQARLATVAAGVHGLTVTSLTGPVGDPPALAGNDAVLQVVGDRVVVTVDAGKFGIVRPLGKALNRDRHNAPKAEFRTPDGSPPFDPIKSALPTALFIALMSTAFFGTATPLIALRQRGTLRMLSTTPLPRRTFILAQIPVRLLLVTVQLAVVGVIAAVAGLLTTREAVAGLFSGLLGAVMLFGFGYAVAARMRNAEVANGVLALLMPVTMLFSGLFLPLSLVPGALRAIANVLPTTYLVDAVSHSFINSPSAHGITVDWLVLAGSAVALMVLAGWLFDWDAGDER